MFDGNHRSNRRPVNLSGRRRKATGRPPVSHRHDPDSTSSTLTGAHSWLNSSAASSTVSTTTASTATASAAVVAPLTRATILEESRRQRNERHRLQQRIRAACTIQKTARRFLVQFHLAQALEQEEDEDNHVNSEMEPRTTVLSSRTTTRLNVRLGLPWFPPRKRTTITTTTTIAGGDASSASKNTSSSTSLTITTTRKEQQRQVWCDAYAAKIVAAEQQQSALPPAPLAHRIVQTSLQLLQSKQPQPQPQQGITSCPIILRYCLGESDGGGGDASSRSNQPEILWQKVGGAKGLAILVETLLVIGEQNRENEDDEETKVSSSSSSSSCCCCWIQDLWKLAVALQPPTRNGHAILGALILSQPSLLLQSNHHPNHNHLHAVLDLAPDVLYQQWLVPLVDVLTQDTNHCHNMQDDKDPLAQVLFQIIHQINEVTVLGNALDLVEQQQQQNQQLTSPSSSTAVVLQLVHHMFAKRFDLTMLTSLVVRGEDIRSLLLLLNDGNANRNSNNNNDNDNTVLMPDKAADDSSDDESDDEQDDPNRTGATAGAVAAAAARTSLARASKQELQTVPKLNTLYQNHVSYRRKEILATLNASYNMSSTTATRKRDMEALCSVAYRMGNPMQWLSWGDTLLSTLSDTEELSRAREVYVTLLATLLQTTTGLRVRESVSSPFLTKLAVSQTFVEKLWRYILMRLNNNEMMSSVTLSALSVFCDVFSHRLVALKDDDFLDAYTTLHGPRIILVEHVIVQLRNVLYQLYWSNPVRATEIQLPYNNPLLTSDEMRLSAVRGRLLLTGTKLWNSLYERWCRLVRHTPFCDESTWFFPTLTSLVSDNAVVGANRRSSRRDASNSGDMDIDSATSSDDDDDNDDDGTGDHPMTTAEMENEALADAFSDPKMARILTCIPQALPFDRRVRLFHSLLAADKLRTQDESASMREAMLMMLRGEEGESSTIARVAIRRERLYSDSMRQLNQLGPQLKRKVQVSFINQHGTREGKSNRESPSAECCDVTLSEVSANASFLFLQLVSMVAVYSRNLLMI